jgi:rubrerythrin
MMFKSVDDALDFAIAREQEAVKFYQTLANRADNPHTKKVFELFAKEEIGHEKKLMRIKEDKTLIPAEKEVKTLRLADYTPEVEITENMDYQDALIVAMKKEKAAFRLYTDLAESTSDAAMQSIFHMLAQEEAKHKLRFEIEYDDHILTDN